MGLHQNPTPNPSPPNEPPNLREENIDNCAQGDEIEDLDIKLQYAWLDAQWEVLKLELRKRECERALSAAKKRSSKLREQIKEVCKLAANPTSSAKSKTTREEEEGERQDLDFQHDWAESDLDEERPRKKSCLPANPESESRLETPSISAAELSTPNVSTPSIITAELSELEPTLERLPPHPEPTMDQVMALGTSAVLNEWLAVTIRTRAMRRRSSWPARPAELSIMSDVGSIMLGNLMDWCVAPPILARTTRQFCLCRSTKMSTPVQRSCSSWRAKLSRLSSE